MMTKANSGDHDWFELAATVLLSVATVVAAWSAYQSTCWGGLQALNTTSAAARRIEATQHNAVYTAGVQLDAFAWITYMEQLQEGNRKGAEFVEARFRNEFLPAFRAWVASVPEGEIPPGTPFELAEYRPAAKLAADRLNAEADELSAAAAAANQVGDDFVLVAVIMASVLFCAGVGTKVSGAGLRIVILSLGTLLFLAGTGFMLSLPPSFTQTVT